MPDYRAYFVGSDGHFCKVVDLRAPHDTAAIAVAKRLVDGHDVELWQRDRKVATSKTKGRQRMKIEGAAS
jgi:hypothetical protein